MRGKYIRTPEILKKMSLSHLGNTHTIAVRQRMSELKSGSNHPLFGTHLSERTKEKIRQAELGKSVSEEFRRRQRELLKGNRNNWQGGLSLLIYPSSFTEELKEHIRTRDGHLCQKCGVPQCECVRALDVHHIDYDRMNCSESNLISLCHTCNLRVNANKGYWTNFFQELLR